MEQALEGAFFSSLLNRMRPQNNLQLFSLSLHTVPSLKDSIIDSSKQIQILFKQIFNSENRKIQLQNLLPFKKRITPVPFCCRPVASNTSSYRCFDCQIHPRSLICQQCFKNGDHKGHRYQVLKQQGICDCGNNDLLKKSAFCHQHRGEEFNIVIELNEKFLFVMYIRQIFIWIIKLIELGHQKQADKMFLSWVNYLIMLNSQSLYYNKLTTELIFTGKFPMINNMFAISILSQHSGDLIKAVNDLLIKMIMHRKCKEMLLTALITNYNEIQSFQRSKYQYLFYILLSQEDLVANTMKSHPVALNPKRPFHLLSYYSVLIIMDDMPINSARAFLAPILLDDCIPFPFLEKVEQHCEVQRNPVVTVFTQFQRQQGVYMQIMISAIRIIQDKKVLAAILKHYYSFIRKYSFYLNKIILVPQRIFTLALYKYFDYDIKKVKVTQLSQILQQNGNKISMLLIDLCIKFSQCLLQFCQNLNKTTYFENYLNGYAKQKNQIICIDILGIRMIAPLLGGDGYQNIVENLFFTLAENMKEEERVEKFGGWNIFMKLLAQIILSPRTQMVVKAFLSVNEIRKQQIFELFTQMGQITQNELDSIEQLFNVKPLPKYIIDELLVFNPIKKKYTPITLSQGRSQKRNIPLEYMVSLLPTRLSKFVQKQAQKQSNIQLNEDQERLKHSIFNIQIYNFIIQRQFGVICNLQHFKDYLKTLMNTAKSLRCLFTNQSQRVNQIYEMTLHLAQTILLSTMDKQQASKFIDSFRFQKVQQSSNENRDLQKKKELMRSKKEQLMKNRKMKQNQEVFIGNKQQDIQNNSDQICLICKESKNNEDMCYLAKMRFSSLLNNLTATEGQNIVIRSCFHTVHYQCFMSMAKEKQATLCPLCKSAVNIVIPLQTCNKDPLLQKISRRLDQMLKYFVTNNEAKHNHRIITQVLLYFAYFVIISINRLNQISQKDARIIKILSKIIIYNMGIESRRQQAEAIFQNFNENIDKIDSKGIKIFYKLASFIHQLFFWHVDWRGQADLDLSTKILSTIQDFSQSISLPRVKSIIQLINKSISDHQTSELEPLLIILEEREQELNVNLQPLSLYHIYTPPSNVNQLLLARDNTKLQCKMGHQILICIFCQLICCHTCKKAPAHSNSKHQKQCLFFNLSTGGLIYCYQGSQLTIRCLYVNQYQKVWKPELPSDDFYFDMKTYDEMISELKNSNLFCYLITRFEGLKGGNVNDRI